MPTSGRLQYFYSQWLSLTNDTTVLSWVKGYKIPFYALPSQTDHIIIKTKNTAELNQFKIEINKLIKKGAISPCIRVDGDFLSSCFLVPKSNGDKRFILNLKNLNHFIKPPHFKMEDLRTAVKLMVPNCFLATIDLKDAYFLVPIHPTSKKYLRFEFLNQCYEFNCLPFGLNTAPLVWTKIMKPVIEHLRSQGFVSTIFLDDLLLIGRTYRECSYYIYSKFIKKIGLHYKL